jgi:hypothetical protein
MVLSTIMGSISPTMDFGPAVGAKSLPILPEVRTTREIVEICAVSYQRYTVWYIKDTNSGQDVLHEPSVNKNMRPSSSLEQNVLDANLEDENQSLAKSHPILDAREYALLLFERQLTRLSGCWQDVVESYRVAFDAHVGKVFARYRKTLTLDRKNG